MPDLFHDFLSWLEQEQEHPILLADGKRLEYLFDNEILATATLSEDGNQLVLDAWVGEIEIMLPAARRALLDYLVRLNGMAAMLHTPLYCLDEADRIVVSRTLALDELAPQAYLAALKELADQAALTCRLILDLSPTPFLDTESPPDLDPDVTPVPNLSH